MVVKRKGHIGLWTFPEQKIDGQYVCLNCGKTPLPVRCRKWCSDECMWKFMEKCDHNHLRTVVFKERKYTCEKCGFIGKKEDGTIMWGSLILDHIKPIALGGAEFDRNNLQILCLNCNRVKTKEDAGKIAKLRQIEKKQQNNYVLGQLNATGSKDGD